MFDKFREECGVFGIYGHAEAAKLTYLGLYALQHRGQESAGISASDGTLIRAVREMGYVNDIFDHEDDCDAARSSRHRPHALFDRGRKQAVERAADPDRLRARPDGVCHNGNIVNANEIKHRLVSQGSIFQTNSDTEVMVHLYARSQAVNFADALVESVAQLTGAFSFAIMTKDHLVAARDPHGFRPLALGRLGDAWVVCVRNLRARSDQCHLRPRRRAGRGAGDRRRRGLDRCARSRRRQLVALHLRARLFRAARQRGVRTERQRGAHQPGSAARQRNRRGGGCRRAGSGLGRVCRDWLRRGSEDPDALRARSATTTLGARSSNRRSRFDISASRSS